MRPPQPPSRHRIRWFDRYRRAVLAGACVLVIVGAIGVAYAVQRPGDDGASSSPTASASATDSASAGVSGSASPSPTTSKSMSATATPKPTATKLPPSAGGPWPNASNTGVPAGTSLSAYTGPCQIRTAGTVIDAKTVNCTLEVRAANVTIKRSKINGRVVLDTDISGSSKWSYTLVDSEVDAGLVQLPAVSYGNMKVIRTEVRGGATSVQCGEHAISCTVEDSYLHGQRIPDDANWHLGGFLSNGGKNIRIRHNYIFCSPPANSVGEGCTGDLNLLGDFAVISDVVIDSNFLAAGTGMSYCLYGGDASSKPYPNADHVIVVNNVFQRGSNRKCGAYGAVTGFDKNGTGNQWSNNKWDDGSTVPPEN